MLDTATHECDPTRLIHPYLKNYQGPALLARNNQVFSVKDIDSLCKLGDSDKWEDLAVTGKFGRGFNSVRRPPQPHKAMH